MKRCFCFLVVCIALGLIVSSAADSKTVKFTSATTNGPKDFCSIAMTGWQKAMKEASKGDLDMDFSLGGALGGDKELLQQLSTNEIQLHIAGPVVVHHLLREYQCMEAEFVFKDEDHGFRVWNGPLRQELNKKLEQKFNISVIAVGSRGARQVTSNTPIRKPEDLKGVKIRITNPLREEIFKACGALPAPLSMAELYGALRQGVFDAQENPISSIWGSKFYEVQKYINLTNHVWSYWIVSANKKFVDSLSEDHRKIFYSTLEDAIKWLNQTVKTEEDTLLKNMVATGKIQVVQPDVAAFEKVAGPIVKKFAAEKCRPGILEEIVTYMK